MKKTREIALMAMLIAVGVLLNVLSFPSVTYFGRMSLVYSFAFLSGIWLGPAKGCIVAMLADLIQVIAYPQPGVFVPHITISNGLMAVIMGLVYKSKLKSIYLKVFLSGFLTLIICSAGISAYGEATLLFYTYPYTLAKSLGHSLNISSPYLMVALSKLITQVFWITLNCLLTIAVYMSMESINKVIQRERM